ncbi:uncharacterized protein K460DRAFT_435495 [Cucurbitaria berberidis CBS 394.84]|uniref:Uncharacterized protein n=1 Tax=Cucurbitaria berberidis CBS 394.84 TaxID=1168544 RepID=A0A9P4GAS5_9PLEO|nr:uncharacterized protein K460DRAFT_435495 [Cucurbitaria berberidis CBS 394.84]KAF1842160.1 hypothetical protein K460DRAFT_435495 [Cucurbitaria berberidis CBS 394.84]
MLPSFPVILTSLKFMHPEHRTQVLDNCSDQELYCLLVDALNTLPRRTIQELLLRILLLPQARNVRTNTNEQSPVQRTEPGQVIKPSLTQVPNPPHIQSNTSEQIPQDQPNHQPSSLERTRLAARPRPAPLLRVIGNLRDDASPVGIHAAISNRAVPKIVLPTAAHLASNDDCRNTASSKPETLSTAAVSTTTPETTTRASTGSIIRVVAPQTSTSSTTLKRVMAEVAPQDLDRPLKRCMREKEAPFNVPSEGTAREPEHEQRAGSSPELHDELDNASLDLIDRDAISSERRCLNLRLYEGSTTLQEMCFESGDDKRACDYCVRTRRLCVRMYKDDDDKTYKLGFFPLPEKWRKGVNYDNVGFWVRVFRR